MYLGRDSVHIDGVERSPVDIVADVIRHVYDVAKQQQLKETTGAVVTIPVDMDGARRKALRQAFLRADLRVAQFVHEPLAALYGLFRTRGLQEMAQEYDGKLLLVFDWGGGTLDLTLCRLTGGMMVQISNDGTDEVGGDQFDDTILNYVAKKVSETHRLGNDDHTQTGAKARLLDKCERAKIDLSSRNQVEISVSGFFRGLDDCDLHYVLRQDELERVVARPLDKGFRRICDLLDDAGFAPEQVALCVATGGMSNMPAVRHRLHELFGPRRVEIPDETATLIAKGAAWIGSDMARLHLAKNVELALARNSYLPLVKAGTAMPQEGDVQRDEYHLYCTDPRDGVAKFQFCAPKRPGRQVRPNDSRINLGMFTIEVDREAPPFRERLELDIQIDDNLILGAHARSLNARKQDRLEIHDLEFGLGLPRGTSPKALAPEDESAEPTDSTPLGTLTTRANVSNRADTNLIPGELLVQCAPHFYGDTIHHLSEEQKHERLYYQPCVGCGRASNDPICECGATSGT